MSIQRPFDISIRGKTIDGNEENEISWKVSGDIQTAYQIDITPNTQQGLSWSSGRIVSFALKHKLPVATLLNGREYKITITVWSQTNINQTSDPEIFQTSSRPVITVSPMGTVNSFSFNFSATYTQAEFAPLRNYNVNLYDEKKNLIDKSNVKTILPMEHLFTNLQTEQKYYIEFIATSQKGLIGTSGLVLFDVFFYRPKMNVNLQGKNIPNAGIELSWYVAQIILKNNNGLFIDNEKIDLRNGSIIADDGFSIDLNFSLKLWIEQPYMSNIVEQVDLIRLTGENGDIRLQYHDDRKFHVWKTVRGLKSHWTSEAVQGDEYLVLIQQVQDDITVAAEVVDDLKNPIENGGGIT